MSQLTDPIMARIAAHPEYQLLKRRRNTFGWFLTVLILLAYYGFIGLIAFDKAVLAKPLGNGVTTVGIPVALGVIGLIIVLTAVYVFRANREYDRLTSKILKEAME